MSLAAVSISASGISQWVMAAGVLGIAVVTFSYLWARLENRWKGIVGALKIAGILLLLIALLEPVVVDSRPRVQSNYFVIAADNSAGLNVKDGGQDESRGKLLKDYLTEPEQPLLVRGAELFRMRMYEFDARLSPVQDFGGLDFEGTSSQFFSSLDQIARRFEGRPLAGVLVFTDGIATDSIPPEGLHPGLPPIFPVVLGEPDALRDISVDGVTISESAFEDAPVNMIAEVSANGFVGEEIEVRVVDEAGAVVARETQVSASNVERMIYRFQIKPEKFGVTWFAVIAKPAGVEEDEVSQMEATLENNQKLAVLKRRVDPFRVLYLSGRPNWEFKFLNRALADDDQVDLVGLIRVANKMPKFTFKGRRGETSNPLFRGFDGQDELTEQYDEAVLKRINVRDDLELQGGFPRMANELFKYHAVIISKIEAGFFTRDQMNLLQKFVSQRGGGLLVMGGLESFQEGGYYRTPIGEMLPVYLDREIDQVISGSFQMELTRDGWLAPWARLRRTETEELARLETTGGFQVLNQVRDVKPGASVIARVIDEQNRKHPAVVTQRFGRGRVGALMVGDFWNWGLGDEKTQEDLSRFWRQIARWAVADVPDRVEIELVNDPSSSGDRVRVKVRVGDEEFRAMDNASVRLTASRVTVEGGGASGFEVNLDPDGEPGVYSTLFTAVGAGVYVFKAEVLDTEGRRVGSDVAGWFSDLKSEEFRSLQPDLGVLQEIAEKTGGRVLRMNQLASFVDQLDSVEAPVVELHASPLWHNGWWMLVAVICLSGEWGIRRWKGLP